MARDFSEYTAEKLKRLIDSDNSRTSKAAQEAFDKLQSSSTDTTSDTSGGTKWVNGTGITDTVTPDTLQDTSATDATSDTSTGGGLLNSAATDANVANWYRNALGRDPEAAGKTYWENEIASGKSADEVYNAFKYAAGLTNNEVVKDKTLSDANADYTGFRSSNGDVVVDEWARNLLGREATAEEVATYGNLTGVDDANAKYRQFLADNNKTSDLTWAQASQLIAPASTIASTYTPAGTEYKPDLDSKVTQDELVQYRVQQLLAENSPVLQQAANRALQAFSDRGLLNSSMAQQAALEAMTAKAIEIAETDAATYSKTRFTNQDATNTFAENYQKQQYNLQNLDAEYGYKSELETVSTNLKNDATFRQNYVEALDTVNARYDEAVSKIQNGAMEEDEKTATIADLYSNRNSEVSMINAIFSQFPNWKNEWLVSPA